MLTPADRRRSRDFDARLAAARATDRPGAGRRDSDYPVRDHPVRDHPGAHLARHPGGQHAPGVHRAPADDRRDDVVGLILLADRLRRAAEHVEAEDEFRDRLRQRLIAVASVHGINAEPGFRPPPAIDVGPGRRAVTTVRRRVPRRVTVATGTLAGLVALSGVGFASGGANPGDALYGVKRSRESAQLTLARSAVARGQLHLQFARNRLAEATAATRDVPELDRLLDDMDDDTRLGMTDLGTAAMTQHHPAPLDLIDEFATVQQRELARLDSASVPPLAVRRIQISLALLDQVNGRSVDLRDVVGCVGPFHVDALGPLPRACSAATPDEPRVSSDEPAPPIAPRTLPPRSRGSEPRSNRLATPASGSAAATGQSSVSTNNRTFSTLDDKSDPSRTADSVVPQSGTELPTPATGSATDPLVGSTDTAVDRVVGSALTSQAGE